MFELDKVRGVIFDYGGTIDSNGKHWSWVIWDAYQDSKVPITLEQFREAYVYAERFLATNQVILPEDNFLSLMKKKIRIQINYLIQKSLLKNKKEEYIDQISKQCYTFAKITINKEVSLLKSLKERYPMVLVSNFYGNIESVLKDFCLLDFFDDIIESAVVGVRKPDPAIFRLGIEKLNMPAESVVVVGDSYTKDIVPADENGSQTIWLKGPGWEDKSEGGAKAGTVIYDFMELREIFKLQ